MAYEPQEWKPFQEGGTIITADALNYMEAGIASTSSDQEALREYCYQLDNQIKADTQASLDQMAANVNKALKEQADTFNTVNETNFNNLKEYTDDTAAELREEIANVPSVAVAFNTFSWSSSISTNTVTKLSGGTVSGDGPATLSGQGVQIPATAQAAFLTCQMTLPIAASVSGRRFGEVVKDSESAGIRQELYVGNVVGVSLVGVPGSVYYPQVYCGSAGTATAQFTVVTLV